MSSALARTDLVHCHTWYSHFAGLLAKQLYRVPLVLTTHSLEPSRLGRPSSSATPTI